MYMFYTYIRYTFAYFKYTVFSQCMIFLSFQKDKLLSIYIYLLIKCIKFREKDKGEKNQKQTKPKPKEKRFLTPAAFSWSSQKHGTP